ncbi:MAG TPA: hypothetical protein DCM87_16180 [Planctomycetes bacterium]|nr:hypothetical protein [Planctomycetota bacterium]
MLGAAHEAQAFAAGKDCGELARDRQLTLALLKCIEIIGEAAARVSEATRARHPRVPWADVIGMRNRLVHAYFDIDLSLLWNTVRVDVPLLIEVLGGIVNRCED